MSGEEDESHELSDSNSTSNSSSNETLGENCLEQIQPSHFEVILNKTLKKAIYERANIERIVQEIKHLDQQQKTNLFKVLKRHEDLFQRRHMQWTGDSVSIKLKQNVSSSLKFQKMK